MSRIRFIGRAALAGLAALSVAACQTTRANLGAGPNGAPTPILVAENSPALNEPGMLARLGSSRYLYAYTAEGGDVALGLGLGVALGLVGVVAATAITKTRNNEFSQALVPAFSRGEIAFSNAEIAKALSPYPARPASIGAPLPPSSLILYPTAVVLEKASDVVEIHVGVDAIQTDASGAQTRIPGAVRRVPVTLSRNALVEKGVPEAGRVLRAVHEEMAISARALLSGQPAPPAAAPSQIGPAPSPVTSSGSNLPSRVSLPQAPGAPETASAAGGPPAQVPRSAGRVITGPLPVIEAPAPSAPPTTRCSGTRVCTSVE